MQPSFFESFSMVLTEAFAHRIPALVQGRCEVLRGQCAAGRRRDSVRRLREFECALEMLRNDPALSRRWARPDARTSSGSTVDVVLDRYEVRSNRRLTQWSGRNPFGRCAGPAGRGAPRCDSRGMSVPTVDRVEALWAEPS
jgi:hypothetical protein